MRSGPAMHQTSLEELPETHHSAETMITCKHTPAPHHSSYTQIKYSTPFKRLQVHAQQPLFARQATGIPILNHPPTTHPLNRPPTNPPFLRPFFAAWRAPQLRLPPQLPQPQTSPQSAGHRWSSTLPCSAGWPGAYAPVNSTDIRAICCWDLQN